MPNFPKRTRARTAHAYIEMRTPQEEIFMARPSVRIVVPDHLKNLLVDDWEYVTKSMLMVPLPSKAPVNFIIDSYFDEEKGKRRLGSAEADVLEEFVAGMKVYFDKAIGKTLLYKFERPQWAEVRHTLRNPEFQRYVHMR
jgi:mortality factor 4-like protein 1